MTRFPDNSRVCFLGDSITQANGFVSHIVEYYHDNFKESNINFYNCGIGGTSSASLFQFFDSDVVVHKPTHIVLMEGINASQRDILSKPQSDERYAVLKNAFEAFKKNYAIMCEKCKETGAELILCTLPPYAEYQKEGGNILPGAYALLSSYADFQRQFARENGYELIDIHAYMTKAMQTQTLYGNDRVHPNALGHFVMAKCILEHQGFEVGEYKEHAQYLSEWIENVRNYRNIMHAEFRFIRDISIPEEEKKAIVTDYLENEKYGKETWLKGVAELYLNLFPKKKEYFENANRIMEVELKK